MRVILAGGGTGGHIYPALTIAKEFLRRDPQTEILFVGGTKGLESDLIPREGFKLVKLDLAGIPRKLSPQIIKSLWLASNGVMKTFKIIRDFRPDLVVGTGGYVCGPMLLAASILGIPTAIQEQNAFPGLTNRILGRFVKRVFLAYPEAGKYFSAKKILIPGNPIRHHEFTNINRAEAAHHLGIRPDLLNIMVFGGSQSARRITQTILEIGASLLTEHSQVQIIQMTGTKEFDRVLAEFQQLNLNETVRQRWHLVPYFYKIADAYASTDIILARAGAISLAEITCFGIPAVLVPYPFATNNHQEFNARSLESRHAAVVINEDQLTAESLRAILEKLIQDQALRTRMAADSRELSQPRAVESIVTELLQMATKPRI